MQAALEHHQAGRLLQAEAHYRQILRVEPDHPVALNNAGLIAGQMGRHPLAAELFCKAISADPSSPVYRRNLGDALQKQGRLDEAIASYREALSFKPDFAEVRHNLGNALLRQGKLDEAAASYREALSFKPDYADAHNGLGNALLGLGKLDEAVAIFRQALSLKPFHSEAHNGPWLALVHNNLGNALLQQGKPDEAVASFRNALSFKADYADAYSNLGLALVQQDKLDEAVASLRKALSFKPDSAEAHCNLGNTLKEQGKLDEAVASYRQAISLKPDYAEAHCNLGLALLQQGKPDESVASYRQALWFRPDYAVAYSNLLFLYGYHGMLEPQEYLLMARGWDRACLLAEDRQAARSRAMQRLPLAGRRLKVGYVSGDYLHHAVSYFVEQLFSHHDRSRIELFAYSSHSHRDAVTARLQALAEHWALVTGMSDAAIRERIEADGIDVLVDLSGHTGRNRLGVFARRAAPVQAHYLGFFASTGLTEMDYWVGDDILTPAETDGHFSERVWRLPRVWVSYEGKADAPLPHWRPAQDGSVWVGSFNNLGKLTPATLALWAKVLHALPEARLLLKTKQLADAGVRQRILEDMAGRGIAASRIELQDSGLTPDWPAHMACYDRLDIALDPVGGVGGGTTTCDALWMAVPVVTLIGDRTASRMTASMLNALGRPEWIAQNEAEYIAAVAALARDVERRKSLRAVQRVLMAGSPLCDARELARSLEDAFEAMFDRWLAAKNEQICSAT